MDFGLSDEGQDQDDDVSCDPSMLTEGTSGSKPGSKRRLIFNTDESDIEDKKLKWRENNQVCCSTVSDDEFHLKDLVSDNVIEMDANLWSFNHKDDSMKEKKSTFISKYISLRNTAGGIIRIRNLDTKTSEFADKFWLSVEKEMKDLKPDVESPEGFESKKEFYRKTSQNGSYMDIFVIGSHITCSELNVKESGESALYNKKEKYVINKLLLSPLDEAPILDPHVKDKLRKDEVYVEGESRYVQFKTIISKDFSSSFQKNIPGYVSAFSEDGGSLFFGIEERPEVDGKKKGKTPFIIGLEIIDTQKVQRNIESVIKRHTSWFQRKETRSQNSKEVEIYRLEDPSPFFKVFFHEVTNDLTDTSLHPLYVIEIRIGSFPGVVCCSSKGPESFRFNRVTGEVETIPPEEVLQLLCRAKCKKDKKENKFMHRFNELMIYKGIPSKTRIYEIKDSISEIGKRFSREYFGPRHLLQDNYIARMLKTIVEEKFSHNKTGIAVLHKQLGSIISRNVQKPNVCQKHSLLDLFIFNTDLMPTFITMDSGNCSDDSCKHEILKYNNSSSSELRYSLTKYFAEGFYLLKGCILQENDGSDVGLSQDDVKIAFQKILSRAEHYPVEFKKSFRRASCERLRDAFTINLIKIPSDLCNQVGEEFLNLLTPRQYEILHDRIQDKCQFIQGVPGTGKTVIAICLIEAIQRETSCRREEILYFTENATVCEVIRRKTGCRTMTYAELRRVHSVLKDTCIRNIIIDDAQLIVQHKDKFKWYTLLKNVVKRKNGYLWTFFGDHKYTYSSDSGLPKKIKNIVRLEQIIRSSIRMVTDAKKIIKSPQYTRSPVGHDFDGDGILTSGDYSRVPENDLEEAIKRKLHSLLYEGQNYSVEDIAVLFHEYEDIPECMRCGQNLSRSINKNGPYYQKSTGESRMETDDEDRYWSSEEEMKEDYTEDFSPEAMYERDLIRRGYDFFYDENVCTRELTISKGKKINICNGAFNDLHNHVVVDTVKRYASLDKLYVIHVHDGHLDDGKKYISYTRAISSTFEITFKRK